MDFLGSIKDGWRRFKETAQYGAALESGRIRDVYMGKDYGAREGLAVVIAPAELSMPPVGPYLAEACISGVGDRGVRVTVKKDEEISTRVITNAQAGELMKMLEEMAKNNPRINTFPDLSEL